MSPGELRTVPDRRRHSRGGRRATDIEGFAPLVFVIGGEASARNTCEAILAKLRFAVAPFATADAALAVIRDMKPEVIVAADADRERLLGGLPSSERVPIVALAEREPAESIIEAVRTALRG